MATPGVVYSYDDANHLMQATTTTGAAVQYQFDASGNLLSVGTLSPGQITLSQTESLSTGSAGQNAVLTFSASPGETVTLNFSAIATTPANSAVTISVYDPGGTLLATSTGSSSQAVQLNLSDLEGGTYTVIVVPQNSATATLQLASSGGGISENAPVPLWSYGVLGALLLWMVNKRRRAPSVA